MPFPIYLAMTAAEFCQKPPEMYSMGYMACHFSPYGTGLSNVPETLPPGSMLILNDRTPVCGHDPQLIARQLAQAAEALQCSRVLLDLQRPAEALTAQIAQAAVQALPCPTAVSACYADGLRCPVLVPPVPLLQPPGDYLQPWQGREIWLEIAPQRSNFVITEAGCREDTYCPDAHAPIHWDNELCCRYSMQTNGAQVIFSVKRDKDALHQLLQQARPFGVTCGVGLYQELGDSSAQ